MKPEEILFSTGSLEQQMEKPLTKKQHYVPQFLLRKFSKEEGGEYRCCVYDIKRDTLRCRQNIKNVFSRNFMYDKDNMVEDFLGKNVEDLAAKEIDNILSEPSRRLGSPSISFLRFITVQLVRTQQAYEQFLGLLNEYMKTVFQEIARLNDLDVESARKLSLKPADPSAIKACQTLAAVLDCPLVKDLKHHVVINESAEEFVISDHPIFKYNWYLRDSKKLIVSSIGAAGVQLFFPLSPRVCYCLYDGDIYKYGSPKRDFTKISRNEDVNILNSFQVLNAEAGVVFREPSMGLQVSQYVKKWGKVSTYTSEAAYSQAEKIGEGKMKSTHITWLNQTRVPSMPSFVKIKRRVRKHPVVAKYRNPSLMNAVYGLKWSPILGQ